MKPTPTRIMSALIKVTIREEKGREVSVEVGGHQNEHASGLLREACEQARSLALSTGIFTAVPKPPQS